ncbi:MAG: DUF429 domain-containing protein [Candidatus Altarchaeaceae archaeon]
MELKFLGIDLAGTEKNPTGICLLIVKDNEKFIKTKILYTDDEIINEFISFDPIITAIDAPLSKGKFGNRKCDIELKEYGALPLTLKGMEKLVDRGIKISKILNEINKNLNRNSKIIEVYATASGKILGFYDKDRFKEQKKLMKIFKGIDERILKKDEIDAIFCAITAYLHYLNKTIEIGDEEGIVIIPKV